MSNTSNKYYLLDDKVLAADIEEIINKNGLDTLLNTPDYVLSEYIVNCLKAYSSAKDSEVMHEI